MSRTTSAVLLTLMLTLAECFRNTRTHANAKSFMVKTKTPGLPITTSDVDDHQQRRKGATNRSAAAALLTGVCCMSSTLFATSRRLADVAHEHSTNRANFEHKTSRNSAATWSIQQTPPKIASYALTSSPVRRRVSAGVRSQTERAASARRRLRSSQATSSVRQDVVTEQTRPRQPVVILQLANNNDIQDPEQQSTSSHMGGSAGDPQIVAAPLSNNVNRDLARKYFVGKRYSAHNDSPTSVFNLAQLIDCIGR